MLDTLSIDVTSLILQFIPIYFWKPLLCFHNFKSAMKRQSVFERAIEEAKHLDEDFFHIDTHTHTHNCGLYYGTHNTHNCIETAKKAQYDIQFIHNQTLKICLDTVTHDGDLLEFIHCQTPEICLAAVKQSGDSLQFIHYQTPEICLAAVKREIHCDLFANKRQNYVWLLLNIMQIH